MKSSLHILFAACAAAALSACGGDGGSSEAPPPPPPAPAPAGVTITTGNQTAVTQATLSGALSVSNVQTATDGGAGVQPTGVSARVHALSAIVRRAVAASQQRRAIESAGSASPLAVSTDTEACTVSGTITTTFNDVDGNGQISAGDILTVQFNQCRDSSTSLVNGAAVITMATVPTAEQITGTIQFQSLAATEGGLTATVSGGLAISEADTDATSNVTLTVGTNGLTETMASASYNDVITMNSGFVVTVDEVFAAQHSTMTYTGVLSAQSVPGGHVTVTTPTPFVLNDSDEFPNAGVLQVKGQHGTLLITVQNTSNVTLQVDAEDDGTYESSQTVSWTSLIPQ